MEKTSSEEYLSVICSGLRHSGRLPMGPMGSRPPAQNLNIFFVIFSQRPHANGNSLQCCLGHTDAPS